MNIGFFSRNLFALFAIILTLIAVFFFLPANRMRQNATGSASAFVLIRIMVPDRYAMRFGVVTGSAALGMYAVYILSRSRRSKPSKTNRTHDYDAK